MAFLKRFSFGISIFLVIAVLMYLGTLGMKSLGAQLVEDSNGDINPQEVNRGLK